MGYDIYLRDPVTGKAVDVPGHLMGGGIYAADYHPEKGLFTAAFQTKAHVNITYQYGRYYYEVYEEEGIRVIYGTSGFDSILVLTKMIAFLQEKYRKRGEWVITKRCQTIFYDENGRETAPVVSAGNGMKPVRSGEVEIEVSEGDTSEYWLATAANAIRPLYQLIALAKMRPDCIWDGD